MTVNVYATTGTTSLTTWYPSPTAAYNTVKLATNYISPTVTSPIGGCTAGNANTIFLDSTSNTLKVCTGVLNTATPYCGTSGTPLNNGTLIADTTGTLHVCNNGTDAIYPQICYNSFCSFDLSTASAACIATPTPSCCSPALACPSGVGSGGFTQIAIDSSAVPKTFEAFQTSKNTEVISIVCCNS